jgi:hypothetical protein
MTHQNMLVLAPLVHTNPYPFFRKRESSRQQLGHMKPFPLAWATKYEPSAKSDISQQGTVLANL